MEYTPYGLNEVETEKAIMVSSPPASEDFDAMFACLGHQHRRATLAYFQETGREFASVDELVEYVMERERPTPHRKSITISMHHRHLPKLAANGFVDYDTERNVVTVRERTAELVPQLAAIRSGEESELPTEATAESECER